MPEKTVALWLPGYYDGALLISVVTDRLGVSLKIKKDQPQQIE
jgi:hypothetical protein